MKIRWLLITLFFLSPLVGYTAQNKNIPSKKEVLDLLSIQGKVEGDIVFQSMRTHYAHIMMMNADGTQLKALTKGSSNNIEPQWNHDGTSIYFSSDRNGKWQIYTMDDEGKELQNISQSNRNEYLRGISRDESKILFQTEEFNTMDVYLRELQKVYKVDFSMFPETAGNLSPILSPDGKKIAFLYKGSRRTQRGVYVADLKKNPSGYHVDNIRFIHRGCFSVWNNDSERFMMCFFRPGGTDLYLIHLDSTDSVRLTNLAQWDYFPAWGPHEEWIAWGASPTESHDFKKGSYDIYIQNLRDKKPIRLTFDHGSDIAPSWRGENK